MEHITYQDWKKLELKVGKIVSVERVPKTEKLYRLQVDIRERTIQIVTSLVPYYTEEELLGQLIVVLVNLKPAKFGGELSEGMLLCAEEGEKCVLLTTQKDIGAGTPVT
jgi:tRNA-binding protein